MIGYGRQDIDDHDIAAVVATLKSDFLTCGPAVDAFEAEIRRITGAKHAVAVSNGTSALRLLYQAAGVGPGKRVGVPAVTFVATASQAMLLGAEVVLLDVDPATLNLTPEILERCSEHLDFVVPVHFAGRLVDLAGIAAVAQRKGIKVLDDGAHAFGSTWGADPAKPTWRCGDGRYSIGTALSFHPVKNITTGEGGAICVNDDAIAAKLRSLRHHGIERSGFRGDLAASEAEGAWYHEFHAPSTNERLSDIQCALGASQCRRVDDFKAQRAAQIARYRALLPAHVRAPAAAPEQAPFWHICSAQVDWKATGRSRAQAMTQAKAAGISFMVHYIPLHHQPILAKAVRASDLAGADRVFPGILSIPCYPGLTEAQQDTVIAWFRQLI
jgi:dTDP-4-amino-4,6-dideoxygalactose transaminase